MSEKSETGRFVTLHQVHSYRQGSHSCPGSVFGSENLSAFKQSSSDWCKRNESLMITWIWLKLSTSSGSSFVLWRVQKLVQEPELAQIHVGVKVLSVAKLVTILFENLFNFTHQCSWLIEKIHLASHCLYFNFTHFFQKTDPTLCS